MVVDSESYHNGQLAQADHKDQMKLRDYVDISQSQTDVDLSARLAAFAAAMGFGRFNATLRFADLMGRKISNKAVTNVPAAFLEKSVNPEDTARDPVFIKYFKTSVPFVYDKETYVDGGTGDLWEEQAPFGYRTGINVALHLPKNTHFLFSLDRDNDLPSDETDLIDLMGRFHLLAVHAHVALSRLTLNDQKPASRPNLTPRERDVMQWTLVGKSSWAVGQILALSENTVNHHMKNAMRKFDSSSKHHAALRALELGLISR